MRPDSGLCGDEGREIRKTHPEADKNCAQYNRANPENRLWENKQTIAECEQSHSNRGNEAVTQTVDPAPSQETAGGPAEAQDEQHQACSRCRKAEDPLNVEGQVTDGTKYAH